MTNDKYMGKIPTEKFSNSNRIVIPRDFIKIYSGALYCYKESEEGFTFISFYESRQREMNKKQIQVNIDSKGRLYMPSLTEFMDGDLVWLGYGNHIGLWRKEDWKKSEKAGEKKYEGMLEKIVYPQLNSQT